MLIYYERNIIIIEMYVYNYILYIIENDRNLISLILTKNNNIKRNQRRMTGFELL